MKYLKDKKPKPFQPVTLVVESEEELRELWHRLNVAPRNLQDAYRSRTYEFVSGGTIIPMFDAVDAALRDQRLEP